MQLRYLQTLSSIATEQNSTIVFPIPVDLFSLLQKNPSQPSKPTTNPFTSFPTSKPDDTDRTATEITLTIPTSTAIWANDLLLFRLSSLVSAGIFVKLREIDSHDCVETSLLDRQSEIVSFEWLSVTEGFRIWNLSANNGDIVET